MEEKAFWSMTIPITGLYMREAWQCFEKTVLLHKKIEERYADRINLCVLIFDMDKARKILLQNHIRNFSIASVPKRKGEAGDEEGEICFLYKRGYRWKPCGYAYKAVQLCL